MFTIIKKLAFPMLVSTLLIGSLFDSFFLGFPTTISSFAYSLDGVLLRNLLAFIGTVVAYRQGIIAAHPITKLYLRSGSPSVRILKPDGGTSPTEFAANLFVYMAFLTIPSMLSYSLLVSIFWITFGIKNTNSLFLSQLQVVYLSVTIVSYLLTVIFLYRYPFLEKENPKYPTISYEKIHERLTEIKRSRYK